jgi:hypothetical protein
LRRLSRRPCLGWCVPPDRHAAAVTVLIVGGNELLGVAVDAVLGDVEAVELVLGFDLRRWSLEKGKYRVGG